MEAGYTKDKVLTGTLVNPGGVLHSVTKYDRNDGLHVVLKVVDDDPLVAIAHSWCSLFMVGINRHEAIVLYPELTFRRTGLVSELAAGSVSDTEVGELAGKGFKLVLNPRALPYAVGDMCPARWRTMLSRYDAKRTTKSATADVASLPLEYYRIGMIPSIERTVRWRLYRACPFKLVCKYHRDRV